MSDRQAGIDSLTEAVLCCGRGFLLSAGADSRSAPQFQKDGWLHSRGAGAWAHVPAAFMRHRPPHIVRGLGFLAQTFTSITPLSLTRDWNTGRGLGSPTLPTCASGWHGMGRRTWAWMDLHGTRSMVRRTCRPLPCMAARLAARQQALQLQLQLASNHWCCSAALPACPPWRTRGRLGIFMKG